MEKFGAFGTPVEGNGAVRFPYMGSVVYYGLHRCTGVLIKPSVLMTAAHCVDPRRVRSSKLAVKFFRIKVCVLHRPREGHFPFQFKPSGYFVLFIILCFRFFRLYIFYGLLHVSAMPLIRRENPLRSSSRSPRWSHTFSIAHRTQGMTLPC